MFDKATLNEIRAALEEWETKNRDAFEEEKSAFTTPEGITKKRIYTPLDLEEKSFDYLKDLSFPGEYPSTRGSRPTMFRSELWRMAAFVGFSSAKETNEVWKRMLAQGSTSLFLILDLPTQQGYDPDHPLAYGEVGKTGTSVVSLRDLERFFEGINLGTIDMHLQANTQAAVAISQWLGVAKKQGVDFSKLKGTTQNDMLKEFACRNTWRFPIGPSLRLVTDIITYCSHLLPNFGSIGIQTSNFQERMGNRVQQVAFCLGNTIAYLESVLRRGISIDLVAPKLIFHTALTHEGFFEEIAKIRAMKKVYAKLMKERFKAKDPRSCTLRQYIYVPTGPTLYRPQPINNLARITLAALAAALAGCETILCRTWTEAWGIPTEEITLQSIRAQQIIAYEAGVGNTVDPLGGSYYLESLTEEYEERIWKKMEEIETRGGMVHLIEKGEVQREITQECYKRIKQLEEGKIPVVGLNLFHQEEPDLKVPVFRAPEGFQERRIAEVRELKKDRDGQKVQKALDNIRRMAEREEKEENNLMPCIREAVECYATNGEICDALANVWGEYKQPSILS